MTFTMQPLCGRLALIIAFISIMCGTPVMAQRPGAARSSKGEEAAARHLESIRNNPLLLRAFLKEMPKGADLHNHLSGAIYAESYVKWAIESGLCISTETFAAVDCGAEGTVPISTAVTNPVLNRQIIDAWSMRNWELSGQNGHDHFFDTFGKFGRATWGRTGDMLAEVAARGTENGVGYYELMLTPDGGAVSRIASRAKWSNNYLAMRDSMLALGLRDSIRIGMEVLDSSEADMKRILGCGSAGAQAACSTVMRYLYQVGRGGSNLAVFAQILAGFEMAEMDPRVVGFNLVQPEDYPLPMIQFDEQMDMINTLRPLYRKARISLHAGEFAYGMVPPESLCCHIRSSIERGHAERIGHGVSVIYEHAPFDLLKMMADRGILTEICLTSNDVILGVKGKDHPFNLYRDHGIAMALCTDDEGVSRGDITHEYVKAVMEQGADYSLLKRMARNSLEHAFVAGKSLWRDRRNFIMADPCGASMPGGTVAPACQQYLNDNEKARLQWRLEEQFRAFESRW